jgi:hypothetical protein
MQQLGTDRAFVKEQYSDAVALRIRIETHRRDSHGDTDRILDGATRARRRSPGLRMLDVGCGDAGWCARATGSRGEARRYGPDARHDSQARLTGADPQPTPLFGRTDARQTPRRFHL